VAQCAFFSASLAAASDLPTSLGTFHFAGAFEMAND